MRSLDIGGTLRDDDDPVGTSYSAIMPHDMLTEEEIDQIHQWIAIWFDTAVEQGYVKWPFDIDETMVLSIQTCYRMKISPEEAVYLFYRVQRESMLF